MSRISRRNFISAFSSGLVGLGLRNNLKAGSNSASSVEVESSASKIQKYKPLGKTGLKVSDVSCGAISLFEPNVIRYAYEQGVNYFDTAESYLRTKSESYVGQALHDVRDKVVLTTKHAYPPRAKLSTDAIINRIHASLKRMQTDYIDIAMIHNIDDLSLLENEELLTAYSKMKKEGKIRFTGFSTHSPKVTLKQALNNDFVQVVLTIYNHMEGRDIEPLLDKVHQKGIGTVAMKVFAGGKQQNLKSLVSAEMSYPQAAIRWVLSNPSIDTLIVTMSSYSHVEEYTAASAKPLDRASLKLIADYRQQAHDQYCRVSCSDCLSSCQWNVAVNDVLRFRMYFEDYGMEKEAMRYYAELEERKKPSNCSNCAGKCTASCPFGLPVQEKLIQAHEILSA